jgi:hypothetical protein
VSAPSPGPKRHLEWIPLQQLDAGLDGPTMYAAVEKRGFTLQKKRESAEILMVDRALPIPTEN